MSQDHTRPGPAGTLRVGPADVGHRVSLRMVVGVTEGRLVYQDVLGILLEFGTEIAVERRDGSVVRFTADRLAAGRVVPATTRRPRA